MAATTDNTYPIQHPHSVGMEKIVTLLNANLQTGLAEKDVEGRIEKYGLNSYEEQKQKSIFLILFEQFKSPIIVLLVVAAGVSFSFQHWIEGFAIIGVIFITAALGFFMELQARKSMNELKKMDVSQSKLWRNNAINEIPSERIVPGDILLLEPGDIVPADGRIIELNQFEADESALTGESLPVSKKIEILAPDISLGDSFNMVFKGTSIVKGNAKILVTGTGHYTELGKISSLVENASQDETPLDKKLQALTKTLMWVTAIFATIFIITGVVQGKDLFLIIETAIALAVAAIPEGLPIVATIALTYGMLRMAKRNVLIKKLSAVETLGGINTIFTDKTGTLTENKIKVNSLIFFDETKEVEQNDTNNLFESKNKFGIEKLFVIAALCNNATLHKKGDSKKQIGDPLEIALLQFVEDSKQDINAIGTQYPRIAEEAFSSETKLMGTLHKKENGFFAAAKGAAEELINKCASYCQQDAIKPLTDADKKTF